MIKKFVIDLFYGEINMFEKRVNTPSFNSFHKQYTKLYNMLKHQLTPKQQELLDNTLEYETACSSEIEKEAFFKGFQAAMKLKR